MNQDQVKVLVIDSNISPSTYYILRYFLLQLLVEYRFLTILQAWLDDDDYFKNSEQVTSLGTLLEKWYELQRDKKQFCAPQITSDATTFIKNPNDPVELKSNFSDYNVSTYAKNIPCYKINNMIAEVVLDSNHQMYVDIYHAHLLDIKCRPKIIYDTFGGANQLDSIWDSKNYSIYNLYSAIYHQNPLRCKFYYTTESINNNTYYTSHIFTIERWPSLEHIGIQLSTGLLLQKRCNNSNQKLSLTLFNQIQSDYLDTDYRLFWAPAWPIMSHTLVKYMGFAVLEFGPVVQKDTYTDYSLSDEPDEDRTYLIQWIKYRTANGFIKIDMEAYYKLAGKENWKKGIIVSNFNDPTLEQLIVEKSGDNKDFVANQSVIQILQDVVQLNAISFGRPYLLTYFKKIIHYPPRSIYESESESESKYESESDAVMTYGSFI
jgi:hypothetical protein